MKFRQGDCRCEKKRGKPWEANETCAGKSAQTKDDFPARLKRGASYLEFLAELYGEQSYEKLYEAVMAEQQGAVRQAEEWLADPEAIPAEAEEERYRMVMAGIGLAMA